MPSWNIHTAHVERLLSDHDSGELGIDDPNAFLFGNYIPDIYLGFMVPDTTYHIDYCITHIAGPDSIPVPDANRFWDDFIYYRTPSSPAALSLTLGAWAHLVADHVYNHRFRSFCQEHDLAPNDEIRMKKQGDFNLFGNALRISSHVSVEPGLLDAAHAFRPYSVLADDVVRSVVVADAIVGESGRTGDERYRLLDTVWMTETFEQCNRALSSWLLAWNRLEQDGAHPSASDMEPFVRL